jgi:hypothetical protein
VSPAGDHQRNSVFEKACVSVRREGNIRQGLPNPAADTAALLGCSLRAAMIAGYLPITSCIFAPISCGDRTV